MTSSSHSRRVIVSIGLILLYIAIILTAAIVATALQPGGPF